MTPFSTPPHSSTILQSQHHSSLQWQLPSVRPHLPALFGAWQSSQHQSSLSPSKSSCLFSHVPHTRTAKCPPCLWLLVPYHFLSAVCQKLSPLRYSYCPSPSSEPPHPFYRSVTEFPASFPTALLLRHHPE